jgi:hypothetical protein
MAGNDNKTVTSTGGDFSVTGTIEFKHSTKEQTEIDASAIAYFKASVFEQLGAKLSDQNTSLNPSWVQAAMVLGSNFSDTPLSSADTVKIKAIFGTHPEVRQGVAEEMVAAIDEPNAISDGIKKQLTELIGNDALKEARKTKAYEDKLDKSGKGEFSADNTKLNEALKNAGLNGKSGEYATVDASTADAQSAVTNSDIQRSGSKIIS